MGCCGLYPSVPGWCQPPDRLMIIKRGILTLRVVGDVGRTSNVAKPRPIELPVSISGPSLLDFLRLRWLALLLLPGPARSVDLSLVGNARSGNASVAACIMTTMKEK